MYKIYKNRINNNKIRYRFMKSDNSNLTYAEFLNLLTSRDNDFLKTFRDELTIIAAELDESKIVSYFWECVPVSSNTINKPFEFVAVNSPELKRKKMNFSPFQEHFDRKGNSDVVSFRSLSGDAVLVSPVPVVGYEYGCDGRRDNEVRDYKDIVGFSTDAPQCQWNSLWQKAGEEMKRSLKNSGGATRWLNTHGLVVNYCSIRVDSKPKYYNHQEYLTENANQSRHEQPQILDLSALKEQAISEITSEFAKNPEVSAFELDPYFHQWKSEIEDRGIGEAIEGYKKGVLVNIREVREMKMTQKQPTNYLSQNDYNDWTREQFIAEINRLKAENEELRKNKTLSVSERQARLQQNQQKLEQVQSVFNSKDTQQINQQAAQPNNNYLAPLIVGGVLLVGLVSILVYKKSKKTKVNIRK